MSLPAITESLDSIPEPVRGHYTQASEGPDAGKFVLGVSSVNGLGLERVDGYKGTIGKLRDSENALKARLKAFEGIEDPQAALAALADLEKLRDSVPKGELDKLVENAVGKAKRDFESKTKTLEEQLAARSSVIDKLVIDNAAIQAITEFGGEDQIEILLPYIRALAKSEVVEGQALPVVRLRNEDGTPIMTKREGSTDPMTIKEFVGEVLVKKFPGAFKGNPARGSGAPGGRGRSDSNGRVRVSPSQLSDTAFMRSLTDEARKQGKSLQEYVEVVPG